MIMLMEAAARFWSTAEMQTEDLSFFLEAVYSHEICIYQCLIKQYV